MVELRTFNRDQPATIEDSRDVASAIEDANGPSSVLPPPNAAVAAPTNDVEDALAIALTEAAKAGRFDVVSQLATELQARRLARAPNVIDLKAHRSHK